MTTSIGLLVAAAGKGERLGHSLPKALVPLRGKPLLLHSLERLGGTANEIVIVVTPGEKSLFSRLLSSYALPDVAFVSGGDYRQHSIMLALDAFSGSDVVLIHDAARPLCPPSVAQRCLEATSRGVGACAALPLSDTLVCVQDVDLYGENVERSGIWQIQTPQCFTLSEIKQAHSWAHAENREFTDDASLYRAWGRKVRLVPGSPLSSKVTIGQDLDWLEQLAGLDND